MKFKVFTLSLDPDTCAFDDDDAQAFLEGKDVLEIREHLLTYAGAPMWALMVVYRDRTEPSKRRRGLARIDDIRAALPESTHGLFDALRSWRNTRSRLEGKPPYLVLTNRQLADVAIAAPRSLEALRAVAGVGDARVKSLGSDIMEVVSAIAAPDGPPLPTTPETSK